MLATPRPALLLLLLLLHILHSARAQVNPGESDRDQGAAGATVSFLQGWTRVISIISGTFSALNDPKPAPAWSLCCPAPHLGTCSDLQRPLCVPQVLSCPWQLAGCWTWQSTRALGSEWGPCPWGLTESGVCQVPSYCLLCWAVPSLAVLQQTKAGFGEVA